VHLKVVIDRQTDGDVVHFRFCWPMTPVRLLGCKGLGIDNTPFNVPKPVVATKPMTINAPFVHETTRVRG